MRAAARVTRRWRLLSLTSSTSDDLRFLSSAEDTARHSTSLKLSFVAGALSFASRPSEFPAAPVRPESATGFLAERERVTTPASTGCAVEGPTSDVLRVDLRTSLRLSLVMSFNTVFFFPWTETGSALADLRVVATISARKVPTYTPSRLNTIAHRSSPVHATPYFFY